MILIGNAVVAAAAAAVGKREEEKWEAIDVRNSCYQRIALGYRPRDERQRLSSGRCDNAKRSFKTDRWPINALTQFEIAPKVASHELELSLLHLNESKITPTKQN